MIAKNKTKYWWFTLDQSLKTMIKKLAILNREAINKAYLNVILNTINLGKSSLNLPSLYCEVSHFSEDFWNFFWSIEFSTSSNHFKSSFSIFKSFYRVANMFQYCKNWVWQFYFTTIPSVFNAPNRLILVLFYEV